jgi:hypothetical protein
MSITINMAQGVGESGQGGSGGEGGEKVAELLHNVLSLRWRPQAPGERLAGPQAHVSQFNNCKVSFTAKKISKPNSAPKTET